ncbi:hypothetical protein EGT29_20105 [Pigmentiphaga sp. H8]|uniref:hypothetical protein n=1 Tax=unclassified Pigmentiphaga TaxID=2626614 RepID=UPI000F5B4364|nr:hypothetical protein [Pigmentiphaga sp. H8]AZG09973.1 hypothetical protein EGT29_20105 [Pigmentiphaga sp. H8]
MTTLAYSSLAVAFLLGLLKLRSSWRKRRRLREIELRGGSLCLECDRYLKPHARYCPHCLAEQKRA